MVAEEIKLIELEKNLEWTKYDLDTWLDIYFRIEELKTQIKRKSMSGTEFNLSQKAIKEIAKRILDSDCRLEAEEWQIQLPSELILFSPKNEIWESEGQILISFSELIDLNNFKFPIEINWAIEGKKLSFWESMVESLEPCFGDLENHKKDLKEIIELIKRLSIYQESWKKEIEEIENLWKKQKLTEITERIEEKITI